MGKSYKLAVVTFLPSAIETMAVRKAIDMDMKDILSLRFKLTGEIRTPKQGEFYISGSDEQGEPEVYAAPNDLGIEFCIAVPSHIERQVPATTVKEPVRLKM